MQTEEPTVFPFALPECTQEIPAAQKPEEVMDLLYQFLNESRPYNPYLAPPNLAQARDHKVP